MASLSIVTYSMHFYSAQKKAKFIDEHPRKLSDRSKVHLSFFQLFLLIFLQLFCYMTSYTYSKNSFFQLSILHILSYPFSLNYRTFEPNRAQSISFFFFVERLTFSHNSLYRHSNNLKIQKLRRKPKLEEKDRRADYEENKTV